MARRRKPCEFCEREFVDTIELRNAQAQIQIYPDNCLVSFWVSSHTDDGELNGENDFSFEMNWCPVCGRKVGY